MLTQISPFVKRNAILVLIFGALIFNSCQKTEEPQPEQQQTPAVPLPPLESKPVPAFDAQRALADVKKQVAFGPRVPNSESHRKTLDFLESELKAAGGAVQLQSFTEQGYTETLNLTNVVASFNPQAADRILLLAHWDSRPWADMEKDPANRVKGVPAANDGASGVAVLLEVARQLKDNPPPIGVDILLTDGEDYGISEKDDLNRYFLGAKYFARTKPATYFPRLAILLDMVGDKEAQFKKELNSVQSAPAVVNLVWRTAQELGLKTFSQEINGAISDDHLALQSVGIKAIDIIDGALVGHDRSNPRRQYWHTLKDTPDNISTETLGEVGKLVLTLIYDRFPKTLRAL